MAPNVNLKAVNVPPSPRQRVASAKITAEQRAIDAIELRKAGATYDSIARTLGYSNSSGAYHAIHRAMAKKLSVGIDDLRTLELDRLDALQVSLWATAIGRPLRPGDLPPSLDDHIKAMLAMIRISQRRAKLLGLDMPVKKDITLRNFAEVAAKHYGLDVQDVLDEAQRILAEVTE